MAARKRSAKKRTGQRSKSRATTSDLELEASEDGGTSEIGVESTGRMVVTFVDESKAAVRSAFSKMKSRAGVANVCHAADFGAEFDIEQAADADAVYFDELGIAVIQGEPERMSVVAAVGAQGDANVIVEPEYVNYALRDDEFSGFDEGVEDIDVPDAVVSASPNSLDYVRGYSEGVEQFANSLRVGAAREMVGGSDLQATAMFQDTRALTWGLQATAVHRSKYTGRGIKVAVLDTGFDKRHPDFRGRLITCQSFIPGESPQDRNGHGTHCIGTACGARRPGAGPRYGVATESTIFVGKVLSNAGSGSDQGILAGINWAVRNRCQIVSMSLGRPTQPGEQPMQSYEMAGRRALRAGTLIIAAAGNDSSRPVSIRPVSSPANASSIAAVAAIDTRLGVARFSNAGINPSGGEINFAAPGVDIHSSWPMPVRLRSISGTSMATPHVAGIAALIAEQNSTARGIKLYRAIKKRAKALPLPRRDVGNGLVQAV